MWKNIPEEHRRRYNIIIFVALPICFVISYFLSTNIMVALNYPLDLKGRFLVGFSFIPLYIMSVIIAYLRLRRKTD
jgi:hypothetical protein